jgi:hypothetical protein
MKQGRRIKGRRDKGSGKGEREVVREVRGEGIRE